MKNYKLDPNEDTDDCFDLEEAQSIAMEELWD